MRKLFIFLSTMLVGCCTCKKLSPQVNVADSVATKIVYRTETVIDSVLVEIPHISERVTKRDTMSRLENDYAISEVVIEQDELFHSLATKPQKKVLQVKKEIEYRDSIVERVVEKEVVTIKEVDKPDTWFEKTQKGCFWIMTVCLILYLLWRKIFK